MRPTAHIVDDIVQRIQEARTQGNQYLDVFYADLEMPFEKMHSVKACLYQKLRTLKLKEGMTLRWKDDAVSIDLPTNLGMHSSSKGGTSKVNEIITSEHDLELLASIKILIRRNIIKSALIIGVTTDQLELLYPQVMKHFQSTDTKQGALLL